VPPSVDAGARPLVDPAGLGEVVALNVYCLRCRPMLEQLLDLGEPLGVGLRDRQRRTPVDPERLQRLRVGVLVRLVADDQVGDRRPGGLVVRHLVDAALLQPAGGLEHEVVQQVEDQVAAVVDVRPGPRVAGRVDRQRALAPTR
jgi:hypothetical protein